jgi:steroid delta-isomerase-like uncharacterized protein
MTRVLCSPTADGDSEVHVAERGNETLVRRAFELFNQWDAGRLAEFYAPDAVLYSSGQETRGIDALTQAFASYYVALPDFHSNLQDLVASGDRVVSRSINTGTHDGDLEGIPPTGKTVEFSSMSLYRVEGGKIIEQWSEADLLGLMQQIGAIPA